MNNIILKCFTRVKGFRSKSSKINPTKISQVPKNSSLLPFTLLNRIRPSSEKISEGSLGPLPSDGHRPQALLGAAIQIR